MNPSTLSPQGPEALSTANLAWLMFGIAAVVFAAVLILLLVATIRKKHGPETGVIRQHPHERRTLALVLLFGGVLPAVVLLVVMVLSVAADNAQTAVHANPNQAIEVIGHQWWWEVRYPQQGIVTANEIHIPTGIPVEIKITTADVIHSFWVPQLHGKIDMIPGQTNTLILQADRPGNYRGECAEYCGTQHAKMGFLVVAEETQVYAAWLQKQAQTAPNPPDGSPEKLGQQAFLNGACAACHTIRGTNASGKVGPDLTHIASRQTLGAGVIPNTVGNLAGWITNAQAIKPGNKMPPMDLDPVQIAEILAYLQTLQ